MKEQPFLLSLDTAEEAACPVCKAISRPMIPLEKYTCGHCDHTWQPATHADMQPLFVMPSSPPRDECKHCAKIKAHLAAHNLAVEVRCRRGHLVERNSSHEM